MRDKRLGRARGTAQAAPTPQPRTPSQRPPIPPPPVAKFFGRQDVFRPSPLKPSGPFDLECFLDPDTRRLVGLAQGGLLLGSPTDVAVTVPLTEGFITGMTMYVVGDSVRAATVRVRRPDGSAVITQCGAVPLAAINPVQLIPGVPGTNYLTSLSGETRGGGGVGVGGKRRWIQRVSILTTTNTATTTNTPICMTTISTTTTPTPIVTPSCSSISIRHRHCVHFRRQGESILPVPFLLGGSFEFDGLVLFVFLTKHAWIEER